jgi:hypothetical protein
VFGVPTPDPGLGVPTPVPGRGVPTPVPDLGAPTPEPGVGVPIPPLFVAGVHGSILVPLLIVVGFVEVTDPLVAVEATLPALPEVPTVGVVEGAPGVEPAPLVGAAPVDGSAAVLDAGFPGVGLDVVVAGGVAARPVVPVVFEPGALPPVAEVPAALPDRTPLPTRGVPAGLPVTPATPGAVGSQGVSGVDRGLV